MSEMRQRSVPEPTSSSPHWPFSIGPPGITMVGRSTLAAPMSCAGVVLSQPHRSTTPSIGLPRSDSSTSIDMRLRQIMVVGFINDSPSDIVGNSSGRPPASQTPRLTCSATMRRCALHVVSSLHELQMPITGRPSKTSGG